MTKKEFPSQERYRKNHPTVTFRLLKKDKARLDAIIKGTGMPLSQWATDFIHNHIDPDEKISELVGKINTLEEYINGLENEERFTVPCSVCGELMYLSSNNLNWMTEVQPILKQAFSNWYHVKTCKPK